MESKETCPICGKTLEASAPKGLCPECLMQGALPSGTETAGKGLRFVAPPVSEVAAAFPQLEVLEFIGQGGMGAVYKARQPRLDRLVALKILPPQAAGDPGFAERFTREARALARLSHPQIVAIYEFGEAGALHYLVMEYVEGANLREIERAGRMAPEQALAIVPQICAALQYAHQEGIVHRDIKPENILIDKKGRLKITDFGIAKIVGGEPGPFSLTGARDIVGTPLYMAPEQIERPRAVDHRADIYSLGVVFYEMLTGELPLGRFEAPSQRVQVDVRLDEVVLRALEKEPARRYQQAEEIKTRVETISSTAPPPKPPEGEVRQVERSRMRRKRLWQFGAVTLAVVIVGATVLGLERAHLRHIAEQDTATFQSQLRRLPDGAGGNSFGARRSSFSQRLTPLSATAMASSLMKSGIDRVVVDQKTAVIAGRATTGEALYLDIEAAGAFQTHFEAGMDCRENTRFTNIIEARGESLHYRVLSQAGQDIAEKNEAPPAGENGPILGAVDLGLRGGTVQFSSGPRQFADAETGYWGTNEAIRIGTYISNAVETPVMVALIKDVARRSDDIQMPFTNDPAILGRWQAVDFVDAPAAFDPARLSGRWLWLRDIQFASPPSPNGLANSFEQDGKVTVGPDFKSGTPNWKWTKGLVLMEIWDGWHNIYANWRAACHYEIRDMAGADYMFLEWKNDDYAAFDAKPKWYVLKRLTD